MLKYSIETERYPEISVPPRLLMGPGPSLVDPRVLRAMTTPLLGHLDPHFVHLMDQVQDLLRYTFQTKNRLTIPISGTGSAAMEAALVNLIEPGDSVLVCINGYFGLRMADMAGRCGGVVSTISRPWGEVFSAEEVRRELSARPAKIVAIVHAETSTGAKQPLREIIDIVHASDALIVVDAVTSLGGIPLEVDEMSIDACYSGSQKCLSAPPGISPITLGAAAVEKMENRRTSVANWYLDLTSVQKYWGNERTYHHTAPISAVYAIYEALRIVAQEGLSQRWQRHRLVAEMFWEGLDSLGLECHIPEAHRLETLTTIRVPEGVDELFVRQSLLRDYNIEISGGLGELKGKIWRVGLMGFSARNENVILLLSALERILNR